MQRVKGMRDFSAEMMQEKNILVNKIKQVFDIFNFKQIDTPVLEYFDTLTKQGTGGSEIEAQTFNFLDFGKRRVGLRYDLTVPLARYLSQNTNFSIPQKLQRFGKVWRYEDTKKGRYREFCQYDIDIIGSKDQSADAQILFCAYCVMKNIGITNFAFQINNRKLIDGVLNYLGIALDQKIGVMRTIDKIEKLNKQQLLNEFHKYGIEKIQANEILNSFALTGPMFDVLKSIKKRFPIAEEPSVRYGFLELEKLAEYLTSYGIDKVCKFNLSIVRGLDYYTGNVFETTIKEGKQLGNVCGGGRYDQMLGTFIGKEIPCTGISFGVDRLLDYFIAKKNEKKAKKKNKMNKNALFIANADKEHSLTAMNIASFLREKLKRKKTIIETEITGRNLSNQIKYASNQNIRYVLIVGRDFESLGKITLKDLEKHTEEKISSDLKKIYE
ncbi:MAG: histidine--tRNA ligase [Candidatus Aenigmarchaeota archaeon ex4484_52]|nr:MAG: histidine--tRNA ligase [Candidatus Aenigmarchaeota archaeon ex4484_52]